MRQASGRDTIPLGYGNLALLGWEPALVDLAAADAGPAWLVTGAFDLLRVASVAAGIDTLSEG